MKLLLKNANKIACAQTLYFEYYKTRIGKKSLKGIIDTLYMGGVIYEDRNPNTRARGTPIC